MPQDTNGSGQNVAATLALGFFKFMGVTGWLAWALALVTGVTYSPYNQGHWLLFVEWGMIALIWLLPKSAFLIQRHFGRQVVL